MSPYALITFVVVVVFAAVQSQDCSGDPKVGAFEYSEFCRPLRDREGVQYGEACADTKLNDKILADFPPSCIRLKFRADAGYQLNKLRGGAHFNEPPTEQARFTSYRDIDRWKESNDIVDPVTLARVLICPEEIAGMSDCCGETVNVVAYAIVSLIPDGEEIRVFLSEDDADELCATREEDNTTACGVTISCPICGDDQCRGPGGVCSPPDSQFCPPGSLPYVRPDEFCDCCGGDYCLDSDRSGVQAPCVLQGESALCEGNEVLGSTEGLCTCECSSEITCTNLDGVCQLIEDFDCPFFFESPARAPDGTCKCEEFCAPDFCLTFAVHPICLETRVPFEPDCDGGDFVARNPDEGNPTCLCCPSSIACIDERAKCILREQVEDCPTGTVATDPSNGSCKCVQP